MNGVQIHLEEIPSLASLGRDWLDLDAVGYHSFFSSWGWIGAWLKSIPSLDDLYVLRFVHCGEIVGLAILRKRRVGLVSIFGIKRGWINSTGDPNFDNIVVEHNAIASRPGFEESNWSALLTWSLDHDNLDELIIPGVDGALRSQNLFSLAEIQTGYRVRVMNMVQPYDAGSLMSKKSRQKLRRSRLECSKIGPAKIEIAKDSVTALRFFEQLKRFHTHSWQSRGKPGAFSLPYFEQFCLSVIENNIALGAVHLARCSAGNETMGILLNFERRGVIYNYQSGFNDEFNNIRPGYFSHALAIEYYAGLGFSSYDFLAKANQLKLSFGSERYNLRWIRHRKFRPIFMIEKVARILSDAVGR